MFLVDEHAALVATSRRTPIGGSAAIWTPDASAQAAIWCEQHHVSGPTLLNWPWSGVFLVAASSDGLAECDRLRFLGRDHRIVVQNIGGYETPFDDETPEQGTFGNVTFGGATFGGAPYGGGAPRIHLISRAEFAGVEPFDEMSDGERLTSTTEAIARTSSRAVRERAISVVEEIARELANDSLASEDARSSARVVLETAGRLREYLDSLDPQSTRINQAWLDVTRAAKAFLPDRLQRGLRLASALHRLWEAYEYPVSDDDRRQLR